MLRPLTALFVRPTAWTVSLALHAGLALVGGGALSRSTAIPSPPIEVEIDWETPASPAPAADATDPWNVLAHLSAHTHPHVVAADPRLLGRTPAPHGHDSSLLHAPAGPAAHLPAAEAVQPGASSASPGASLDEPPPASPSDPPLFVLTAAGMRAKTGSSDGVEPGALGERPGPTDRGGASHALVGASTGAASDGAQSVFAESAVDVPARLIAPSTVEYPAEARASGVEAEVPVEIVLDERGAVISERPLRPAGYGFDEAALRAVRLLRFAPSLRGGRAVRVRMRWPVVFRLR